MSSSIAKFGKLSPTRFIHMRRTAKTMAFVRSNDIDYQFEEWGIGPPVVLLHGFMGSSASWNSVRDELVAEHRVVAIDLIGHGASGTPPDAARYAFEQVL